MLKIKGKTFARTIAILLFLGIIITVFSLTPERAKGEDTPDEVNVVVVRDGDSLWQLALTYGPQNQDPRKTIYRIQQRNDLKNSSIYPGQLLIIPAE